MPAYHRVPPLLRGQLKERMRPYTNDTTRLIGGSADTLYIPGKHRHVFMDTLALFLETDCFLEIATPTTVHLVAPPDEPILFVDHVSPLRDCSCIIDPGVFTNAPASASGGYGSRPSTPRTCAKCGARGTRWTHFIRFTGATAMRLECGAGTPPTLRTCACCWRSPRGARASNGPGLAHLWPLPRHRSRYNKEQGHTDSKASGPQTGLKRHIHSITLDVNEYSNIRTTIIDYTGQIPSLASLICIFAPISVRSTIGQTTNDRAVISYTGGVGEINLRLDAERSPGIKVMSSQICHGTSVRMTVLKHGRQQTPATPSLVGCSSVRNNPHHATSGRLSADEQTCQSPFSEPAFDILAVAVKCGSIESLRTAKTPHVTRPAILNLGR